MLREEPYSFFLSLNGKSYAFLLNTIFALVKSLPLPPVEK